jgi:methylthioribose-1-phosphate isomerase
MKVNGQKFRSIWKDEFSDQVKIIDQRFLPHTLEVIELNTLNDYCCAIADMKVRGAPLIGVTAGFAIANSMKEDATDSNLIRCCELLSETRPTAVNLFWAINYFKNELSNIPIDNRAKQAIKLADMIAHDDIEKNKTIGEYGSKILHNISQKKNDGIVNVLTHCNAGWLATVDWGTALSPIFRGNRDGLNLHIWVDETRPRNQGGLTAWELMNEGIDHTLIVDNAGGHLMQKGLVDIVIVGSDRTTASGDVCNKIGTYLKALAAKESNIPFYAALPSSTIDWNITNGLHDIPIENRSSEEMDHITGLDNDGDLKTIRIYSEKVKSLNPAFDVTPSKFIDGIITEKGIINPDEGSLRKTFNKHLKEV